MWPTHIPSFRYGRRRSTQLPVLLALIFGVVAGLSPNFYFYLVSQFVIAATLGGFRMNSIVLGTNLAHLHFTCSLFPKSFIFTLFFPPVAVDFVCSDWMDWSYQEVIGGLFESGVCRSGTVSHRRLDLCHPRLENHPVRPRWDAGLCAAVHLVRNLFTFYP